MRQLTIHIPRGHGAEALEIAKSCDGSNLALSQAINESGETDVLVANVNNARVGEFLERLQELPDLRVTMFPSGVIVLKPPAGEAPEQVTDVSRRSSVEVFLAGLQSVGSWRGFLGYATIAGVVVWMGLFTNTNYLLVAAMLIAPFAGPAMNSAIATARGDGALLRRSVGRYFAALAATIFVTWLLSLLLDQRIATTLMVDRSQISAIAVLLPLVAGAAGALNLVQSERSSLVTGAATGMLIAASLAPPAGVVGMAAAIGRWDMMQSGLFLLLLQLAAINLSGWAVFRFYGKMTPAGIRFPRGKGSVVTLSLATTAAVLAGLLLWQFWTTPNLQRSSRSQRATAEIHEVIRNSGVADLIEANVRFTRANIAEQNSLLAVIYVQRKNGIAGTVSDADVKQQLTRAIQRRLLESGFNVTPLVDVTVLDSSAELPDALSSQ
jgi:uncharacterized hydrophobic protein (TIGR00271 family)